MHPRRLSDAVGRPLNFTVRSRLVTQGYTQTTSKIVAVVAGILVLAVGVATALLTVTVTVGLVRNPQSLQTGESWVSVLVMGMFGTFATVLCTAGYRLLFRTSDGAGSMLPRFLWLVLCVVLGGLGIFVLVVPLLLKQFYPPLLYSSMMMGGFSWWCYRFARRESNRRGGAASNNRWRGP